MSILTTDQLKDLGLKSFGSNVSISDKASLYKCENIEIGSNVRIDDFCVLSGTISIGNNVHIANGSRLIGEGGIVMCDYSGLSAGVSIFSSSDDYSGKFLTNPTNDKKYLNIINKLVYIGEHTIIGLHSVILPGVCIGKGSAIGALSLVKENVPEHVIMAGNPLKFIKNRDKQCFILAKTYENEDKIPWKKYF